ncbi:hypothetical protein P280DRAFT_480892 [Massarina eburnea CBS 473.64]|uniref:Uncharacterized protein n=1 Tax=Massarina eburnea CBS 473.64 TaxID=1395130 RepID=A0A6A6RV72_9PLEO|nr:hypothetical protein P280DRAFT_480892 [Massarina eburnea CBS 473.64]
MTTFSSGPIRTIPTPTLSSNTFAAPSTLPSNEYHGDSPRSQSSGVIVGAVLGSVIFLMVFIIGALLKCRRITQRKAEEKKSNDEEGSVVWTDEYDTDSEISFLELPPLPTSPEQAPGTHRQHPITRQLFSAVSPIHDASPASVDNMKRQTKKAKADSYIYEGGSHNSTHVVGSAAEKDMSRFPGLHSNILHFGHGLDTDRKDME